MIKIYDTMTRSLREFVPIEEGKVRMYVCGPTVYNYIHVGNARSTVAFDTVRRYFEYRGFEVNYISNFTDVDDKIINRAKEEGITPKEVAWLTKATPMSQRAMSISEWKSLIIMPN